MNTTAARRAQKKDARRSRFAKINLTWKQLRPDLRGAEELREARLQFAEEVLGGGPIGSFSELTIPELDRVIAAMVRSAQGTLPEVGDQISEVRRQRTEDGRPETGPPSSVAGQVVHLASEEQVWAIERILEYLQSEWGWSKEGCEGFLRKNYRRSSPRMLKPRQASGAVTILLSIVAKKEIDRREGKTEKRTRADLRAEMPALKKRIGIGRRETEDRRRETAQ